MAKESDLLSRRRILVELKVATALARGNEKKAMARVLKKYSKENKDIIK